MDAETVGNVGVTHEPLAADGTQVNTVFTVTLTVDDNRKTIVDRPELTAQRRERASSRVDRLSKRPLSRSDNVAQETEDGSEPDTNGDLAKDGSPAADGRTCTHVRHSQ